MEISEDKIQRVKWYVKDRFQKDVREHKSRDYPELLILTQLGIITIEEVKRWDDEAKRS